MKKLLRVPWGMALIVATSTVTTSCSFGGSGTTPVFFE